MHYCPTKNHWLPAQWPPARILTRRWRVRVLLVPNAPTVADLPPDSGLLGDGLRGGITSAVERTVEYPPPHTHTLLSHKKIYDLTFESQLTFSLTVHKD
ncbi:hypothetical protein Hanom_Chr03g00227581 [Helianthus anomalus]